MRLGIGSDSRIGPSFLFSGVGYGGSCLPKDVKALVRTIADFGLDGSILEAVEAVNEAHKRLLLDLVVARFGGDLSGHTFAVWGLAFKPNTDDMRDAPSLVTIGGLLDRGARVVAHDPVAMPEARRRLGDLIECRERNYDVLEGADALLIHTEWHPYRRPAFDRMREDAAPADHLSTGATCTGGTRSSGSASSTILSAVGRWRPGALRSEGRDYGSGRLSRLAPE